MKIIFFLFLFFLYSFSFAQEEKLISGKIVVVDAKVSGVTILNLTNEKETITDSLGNFKILVKKDDLLIFFAPHLDKMRKLIDDDAYKNPLLKIEMTSKVTELDEVVVTNYSHINAYNLGITPTRLKTLTPAERGKYSFEPRALEFEEKLMIIRKLETLFDNNFFEQKLKIQNGMTKAFLFYCVEEKSFMSFTKRNNKDQIAFYLGILAHRYNELQTKFK